MIITKDNSNYWNGEDLFFCKTCGVQLPKYFNHPAEHNIIPLEWVRFCGNCNEVIEDDWSYCAFCGQKFGDW